MGSFRKIDIDYSLIEKRPKNFFLINLLTSDSSLKKFSHFSWLWLTLIFWSDENSFFQRCTHTIISVFDKFLIFSWEHQKSFIVIKEKNWVCLDFSKDKVWDDFFVNLVLTKKLNETVHKILFGKNENFIFIFRYLVCFFDH